MCKKAVYPILFVLAIATTSAHADKHDVFLITESQD